MPPAAAFDRATSLRRLGAERFDVLVIGGGITGVGVALDAAGRGLTVALVDKGDLASGTSSKSSKLAHGGLRYLQQGEIGLVYEALHERQRLLHNAPHLVRPLPFLIPVTAKGGVVNRKVGWALGKAMWLYDLTGGARIGKLHRRLSRDETIAHLPTAAAERVAYGYLYHDAQVDDARLTLAVARTAASLGAAVATYAPVVSLRRGADGAVHGAVVHADGADITVDAAVVVNASGVWTDALLGLDEPGRAPTMRPAKGVHLTVPWDKVRNDVAVVIPVREDRRSLFLVPWIPRGDGTFELTYVGTTDTDYQGPLDDPACTADDVAYVLRALNASVTTGVTEGDVVASWAGLRPLVAGGGSGRTADLSRRHLVTTDPDGVVTVTGGKLTTYRRMAADGVDEVVRRLGRSPRRLGRSPRRLRSRTARQRLVGAPTEAATTTGPRAFDLPAHLPGRYGTEAPDVAALAAADARLAEPLVPGLPYLAAEAVWAVRREMATTLADVLDRRTRARLQARDATADAAAAVAELIGPELGWDATRIAAEAEAYRAAVAREREDAGLPLAHHAEDAMATPTPPIPFDPPITALAAHLSGRVVALSTAQLDELAAATGTEVVTDAGAVMEASRDWWPLAMAWAATAGAVAAHAAAVVRPADAAQVAAVLRWCDERRIPVTAAAGRSGVCGASVPLHGGVVLDTTAMQGIVAIDDASLTLEVLPGTFGHDLEAALRERGYTLGHWPQSIELSTVGGWLACRSAGQYSTRYGKIEHMVVGLEVALADGRVLRTGGFPAAAVGPDLTQLFVGSEGTLGVITRAWLRLHPAPPAERRAAWAFATFEDGLEACRNVLRRGATPAVLRLYDVDESKRSHGTADTANLLVLDEGDPALVDATMRIVAEECERQRATTLDVALVERWMHHRNDVSALAALTKRGYVVDTLEVAAPWSALPGLFRDVRTALLSVPHARAATCHLSHSYGDGACLYFTLAATPPADERNATYVALWDAGQRAALAAGANLSHHHGVGLNRARFVAEALGPAFDVLVAVKRALDPHGVLNPGKLGFAPFAGEAPWP